MNFLTLFLHIFLILLMKTFVLLLCLTPSGRAASEAHPVSAAPPEAAGLRAQLPPAADLADQDGEPGPGH